MNTPTELYNYDLTKERIAQYPPKIRGTTNLMIVNKENKKIEHKKYFNIVDYIKKGDLVVLNDTRIIPARLFGQLDNGKNIEILLLNPTPNPQDIHSTKWTALLGKYKKNYSSTVHINPKMHIKIKTFNTDGTYEIEFNTDPYNIVHKEGHVPLPKYIKRDDEKDDAIRYQTVFSRVEGSVASPTASINLTKKLISKIEEKAQIVYITLYVSWGTFSPIRTKYIENHKIHTEFIQISKDTAQTINSFIESRKTNPERNLIAFGTTVCRTLESVYKQFGKIVEYSGETDLYIYPPFEFKTINSLVTNFHAPNSSLLTLVSAFMGYELMQKSYRIALDKKYNFLSYGDSMLIHSKK